MACKDSFTILRNGVVMRSGMTKEQAYNLLSDTDIACEEPFNPCCIAEISGLIYNDDDLFLLLSGSVGDRFTLTYDYDGGEQSGTIADCEALDETVALGDAQDFIYNNGETTVFELCVSSGNNCDNPCQCVSFESIHQSAEIPEEGDDTTIPLTAPDCIEGYLQTHIVYESGITAATLIDGDLVVPAQTTGSDAFVLIQYLCNGALIQTITVHIANEE